jgi:translation initiation factor 1
MSRRPEDPIVWSTERGDQREPEPRSKRAPQQSSGPPSDGVVRVGRETQGRKGKGVTTITGVPLRSDELLELAAQLKRRCGTGGTVKDGVIEIQGDHRDDVIPLLATRGWTVKRTGG